jgi:tetratricopeptide (TPR) repeat protein
MYSPLVRILIVIGSLALMIYYHQKGSVGSSYLMVVAIALVVWGYFKNGTVYLAWRKLKKQQYDDAERVLRQTKYPHLLKKEQRGYYHFSMGLICMNRADYEPAFENFKAALVFGVRTENNAAIANLNLAAIALERGNEAEAKSYLETARSLKYSEALEPELQKLETRLQHR